MPRRAILSLVLALSALALTTGLTASLDVAVADLGAGSTVISACDNTGVDLSFGLSPDGRDITEVRLANVDVNCDGQAVTVVLEDASGPVTQVLGTADTSGSVTLPVTGSVPAADIVTANVVITG